MQNIKITALGGLGEIGMNCMLIESEQEAIVIDCGAMMSHSPHFGYDTIIPSFELLKEKQNKIKALVLTHGHEDHIGAIAFLMNEVAIPKIVLTPMTQSLLENKLKDVNCLFPLNFVSIKRGSIDLGDFKVEYIPITHSYVESYLLFIETPVGNIVHSGDFKLDSKPYDNWHTDSSRIQRIAEAKCLLLMSDSTNSERPGRSKSESEIDTHLQKAFENCHGRLFVTSFASNIQRTQHFIDLAIKNQRKIFFHGRAAQRFLEIGLKHQYLSIPGSSMGNLNEIEACPRARQLVFTSGSQGEFGSGLVRMSFLEDPYFVPMKGDRILFSSLKIPGNEIAIRNLINRLMSLDVDVWHSADKALHVTGHAYQEEQRQLIEWIQPKFFMPIHGDLAMQKAHAQTAEQTGIVQEVVVASNGDSVELTPNSIYLSRAANFTLVGKRWCANRKYLGGLDSAIIKQKKRIAREGLLIIIAYLENERLLATPEVELRAMLMSDSDLDLLKNIVQQNFEGLLDKYFALPKSDSPDMKLFMEQKVRAYLRRRFFVSPEVVIFFK